MEKQVTLITKAESAFSSWAEQMLIDKVEAYHRRHLIQNAYKVVKESEKAYQIEVEVHNYDGDPCGAWNIWMPKSAFVA